MHAHTHAHCTHACEFSTFPHVAKHITIGHDLLCFTTLHGNVFIARRGSTIQLLALLILCESRRNILNRKIADIRGSEEKWMRKKRVCLWHLINLFSKDFIFVRHFFSIGFCFFGAKMWLTFCATTRFNGKVYFRFSIIFPSTLRKAQRIALAPILYRIQ